MSPRGWRESWGGGLQRYTWGSGHFLITEGLISVAKGFMETGECDRKEEEEEGGNESVKPFSAPPESREGGGDSAHDKYTC